MLLQQDLCGFRPKISRWKSTGALGIKRVEGEVIVIGTWQPFGKPEIGNRQFLVRNEFLSVEPAMRGWVNAVANYSKPGRHRRSHAVFRSGNDHRFTPSRLC
jgi:N-terminal domain of oxidoreductase